MSGYRVRRSEVDDIICHRNHDGVEQYLVRWKSDVLSWHPVGELTTIISTLQNYVTKFLLSLKQQSNLNHNRNRLSAPGSLQTLDLKNRKRKSLHEDISSPAPSSGTNTPDSSTPSRVISNSNNREVVKGRLSYNAGDIYPVKQDNVRDHASDVEFPTHEMINDAIALGTQGIRVARRRIGAEFKMQLALLPGPKVTVVNNVDKDMPSLNFKWISDYVLGEGVTKLDEVMVGCEKCRPDMGQGIGCEYTRKCDCLEYAAPDPARCKTEDEIRRYKAWERKEGDASDLPKRFPYMTGTGLLNEFYLNSRHVVYECNSSCRCGPNCKNKVVQWGRKVPLEIFKTEDNRGFGLRCPKPLNKGQFIDKYLGELITDAEADRREKESGPGRASYLFWLDKHAEDDDPSALNYEDCYVADGERMGGPTRFINHSCDPNCRLFTVSYNKHDQKVYDLAFFALRYIAAGEELTFDYVDPEEGEAGKAEDVDGQEGKEAVPCRCGAKNCRGKLWM